MAGSLGAFLDSGDAPVFYLRDKSDTFAPQAFDIVLKTAIKDGLQHGGGSGASRDSTSLGTA
jgi:hypothetical protein